jgi:hypothetical protein
MGTNTAVDHQTLELGRSRRLGEIADWFRSHRADVFTRMGWATVALDEKHFRKRESHSMDHGRDAPAIRPYSEHERTTAVGVGVRWEVALDVAYWNPAEIATASLAVRYDDRYGRRLSIGCHLRDGDRTGTLDLAVKGVPDRAALIEWLRTSLAGIALAASTSAEASAGGEAALATASPNPEPEAPARDVLLREATVGRLGEARVGCGNFWQRRYALADGSHAEGLSARLAFVNGTRVLIVGTGSAFELDGRIWRVIEVAKDGAKPGQIRIDSRTVEGPTARKLSGTTDP